MSSIKSWISEIPKSSPDHLRWAHVHSFQKYFNLERSTNPTCIQFIKPMVRGYILRTEIFGGDFETAKKNTDAFFNTYATQLQDTWVSWEKEYLDGVAKSASLL